MLTVNIMIIYKITNKINQKIYIGESTRTIEERWSDYVRELKFSKKPRPIINAMRKYGIDNFSIEVIEENIQTKEQLDSLEKHYIKLYESCNPKNGYNIENGGNGIGKHAESTKLKISLAQRGYKNHMYGIKGKNNKSSKAIIDITTGEIYDSVTIAAESIGVGKDGLTKIAACARGIRTSAYGKIFRYLDENMKPIFVEIPKNKKIIHPILDITTNIEYNTLDDAAKSINSDKSSVSSVVLGKRNSIFGHKFIRLEDKEVFVDKQCKIFDLVLEKYKYLVNTVPSAEMQRCNDYSTRK